MSFLKLSKLKKANKFLNSTWDYLSLHFVNVLKSKKLAIVSFSAALKCSSFIVNLWAHILSKRYILNNSDIIKLHIHFEQNQPQTSGDELPQTLRLNRKIPIIITNDQKHHRHHPLIISLITTRNLPIIKALSNEHNSLQTNQHRRLPIRSTSFITQQIQILSIDQLPWQLSFIICL